jgi:hypothetical protein
VPKLYAFQDLVDNVGLPERTIRYYLAKVLGEPAGTRGRKAFYTGETLDQLRLAKQVLMQEYDPKRGEVKPSLLEFQSWLGSLTAEEIQKMAEMPYSIKPKLLLEAAAPPPSKSKVETHSTDKHPWQSFQFGADLKISTLKKLTPEQSRQLRLAGQLLQSVLSNSEDTDIDS